MDALKNSLTEQSNIRFMSVGDLSIGQVIGIQDNEDEESGDTVWSHRTLCVRGW